jgi:IclR family acetate operon transcriptional repressor
MSPLESLPADRLVKSSARTLDVLELLARFPDGLTLTCISHHLRIPVSSLHNIVATMTRRGYLLRDQTARSYRVGPKLGQLSAMARGQPDLISVADPFLHTLTHLTGESTSLSILEGDTIVFIHRYLSKELVQVVNSIGTRVPAHATASGKAMLAHLPEEEFERSYPTEQLVQATPATIGTKTELKRALAHVAQQGYAYNNEESAPGVWALASCIHGRGCEPIGALSVAVPTSRLKSRENPEWAAMTRQTASEISTLFGFVPSEVETEQEIPSATGRPAVVPAVRQAVQEA